MQECVTLLVSTVMALFMFREPVRWNILVSYGLIVAAIYFAFRT